MKIGDKLIFGKFEWQVLDIKDNTALIITEKIIEQRAYHDVYKETTWADCALRAYLNGAFYETFSEDEQLSIVEVANKNLNNQWYGTTGGEDTQDRIFLLDIEEVVCKYFGDSSANLQNRGKNQKYWFQKKDINNGKRGTTFKEGSWWWWLRSPGRLGVKAVYIHGDGNIGIQGNNIFKCNISLFHQFGDNKGGVRPAMWIRFK